MLTEKEFENLIGGVESSTLDFKKEMYDFQDDVDLKNTSKFIKDIISFSNTIRNETSYIVVGIEEKSDSSKELHGLNKTFDDAMFQDKIKNKVFPIPSFLYYQLTYKSKVFGVFQFPTKKYNTPIMPVIKLRGLEAGKVYYRQGSMNAEAMALEVIRINNWLQSLPETNEKISLNELISNFIKRLSSGEEKLSSVLVDIYQAAKQYGMHELVVFCSNQIKGLNVEEVNINPDEYKYRVHDVIISEQKISIDPRRMMGVTSNMVKFDMEKRKDFFGYRLLFINPVSEIEDYLSREDGIAIIQMTSKNVFPETDKNYPIYVYVFRDTFQALYKAIRQKSIDFLMKI